MILYTPKNKLYFDKNDIFLGWQKESIFKNDLEPRYGFNI